MLVGFMMLGGISFVIGFAFYKASPLPEPSGNPIDGGSLTG